MAICWSPSEEDLTNSQMARFLAKIERLHAQDFANFESFHRWSVKALETFWREWLIESGIVYSGSDNTVRRGDVWFPDVQLNYAENLMKNLAPESLVGIHEMGRRVSLSAEQLRDQVRRLQFHLKAQGLKAGDRVAAVLPNCPEAIIAMLATASLGGIWSSCSPDFGTQAILDRLTQVEPKFLFVADGYYYQGQTFHLTEKNADLIRGLPPLADCLEVPFLARGPGFAALSCPDDHKLEFLRLPFAAPLFIMFSSGTTGAPKCIVHGAGGTLLQLSKEHRLHCDLHAGEKLLYYTTCGWMMWNWMANALFTGATLYCFDGSPLLSDHENLWKWVAQEKITVFGTSAKFLASCRAKGLVPKVESDLASLRLVLSTGSPLSPEDFDYFYAKVGPMQLSSISGGTDILSCFMLGCPMKPVVRGEIQARGLGMDVQAFNAAGEAVINERGELVCTQPFPSMPIGFWRDDAERSKFRQTYFGKYPKVWQHGDFITITEQGGVIVHGRSDATLNRGGVRIGTSEIYRQLEGFGNIDDTLVVSYPEDGDEKIVLFVKFKASSSPMTLVQVNQIKRHIRKGASPRHVPDKVIEVADIPYTINGKKVELAVKRLLVGEEPSNTEALANPQSLDFYRHLKL